jgi:hypothetical protein
MPASTALLLTKNRDRVIASADVDVLRLETLHHAIDICCGNLNISQYASGLALA